ncbi:MAG: phosphomethylpyrimidine synthase ThiC [Desulfobacterota bacterium]|nr:phosphomethylpyrimidine synthase ThiC [Thermodesulfobacteriota bacterium]
MTQLEAARQGRQTPEMQEVARREGLPVETIQEGLARGVVVLPANAVRKKARPAGIGQGLTIKVNANIGTSSDHVDLEEEWTKLRICVDAGADTVMDLSTGGDLPHILRTMLSRSPLPIGTVPIYQAAVETIREKGALVHLTADKLFEVIEEQAREGVDFVTVHCGVTLSSLERLKRQGRVTDIVSRGGAFLATWMVYHGKENPLFEQYDRLLELARRYDLTLSLGDGLRPGCLADATDRAQVQELIHLGELRAAALAAGVQVMIEGPGHVPLNQVEANIQLQKRLCEDAPFYVLGPLVTDIAAGHDHIACAIGGALAGMAGADFLCYVTPSEHLKLPTPEDVREGIMAARIAAHAADLARGNARAWERDRAMAQARKELDWEKQISLCLDPEKARKFRNERPPQESEVCTMCGPFCAIKLVREFLKNP